MEQASAPDFIQQSLVPLDSETHGGEDLGIYAIGPWAHLFQGTVEENYTFHVMDFASRSASGRRPRPSSRASDRQRRTREGPPRSGGQRGHWS